jgi:hypothetical protein
MASIVDFSVSPPGLAKIEEISPKNKTPGAPGALSICKGEFAAVNI